MSLRPYRCANPDCIPTGGGKPYLDFWAEGPRCPNCGAEKGHARSGRFIMELAPIHFDPPGDWGLGKNEIACQSLPWGRESATNDPSVVTCPACKLTTVWQEAAAAWGYQLVQNITPERARELREAAAVSLKAIPGVRPSPAGRVGRS